ncbi:GRAM domain containing [Aspergillus alliaceus]|uniref:GRAM domain containing n=1 Tax=Petromyces alliaceus TaxID=209559 RepID=A0A8H6A5N8_PETAA|nr:GRAM domain containing [Aspergillus burnettii]
MDDHSLKTEAHPASSSDAQSFSRINRSKTSIDDALGSSSRSNGRSSSIDSTSDRPKSQAGEGTDSAKAGPSGFSKLLATRKKRKKKENQKHAEELPTQFEIEEKNIQERPDEPPERPLSAPRNVGQSVPNDAVNILTDDSEPDRTPLTSQNSHTGFYTSSSLLIKTTSTDANDTDGGQADVESAVSGPSVAGHSESNADTDLFRPTSQPSSTLGVPEDHTGKKRSVSPGRRWKGAFSSSQDKKDSSRDRASSTPSEGKKGGLFGSSRRSSTSSKKAPSILAESPPPLPPLIHTDIKEDKSVQPSDHLAPSTPPRRTTPAPHTTVTPPTPRTEAAHLFASPDVTESPDSLKGKDPLPVGVVVSPSGNMISHRRVRSTSSVSHKPSKLSNSVSALGPTIEEAKAASKVTPGAQQIGFFSSVFSAAQNAASTLSSSLNSQSKARNPSQMESENAPAKDGGSSQKEAQDSSQSEQKKPLAIETLGSGDLDFSHLDIAVPPGGSVSTPDGVVITKPEIPAEKRKNAAVHQRDEEAARLEDRHAARAVTIAYEKPSEVSVVPPSDESLELQSTSSLPRDATGDHTSPSGSILDGEPNVRPSRSGSVRSRLTRRRHRGSSAATTSTAAAAGASMMALGIPGGNASVPRLTGFAVASKKRNRDFHQLFRSVPEDDYLIEDYSCALQREIILAGRIYVSEGHICFSSNILGWVTTLVISFDEIVAVEKESTAMVFPNAIAIQTLHARHTFRSLLSRESTYDLMVNIWKINHPALKSSVNGTRVDQGTGDKTEKAAEESDAASEEEDEIYDEDEDGDNADSFFEPGDASVNGSDKSLPIKGLSRQASGNLPVNGTVPATSNTNGDSKGGKPSNEDADKDFPGPATHAPTAYTDPAGQYDKVVKDEIIPAPLGKVYSYVFGPESTNFIPKFLVDNQKSGELQFDLEGGGLTNESRTRQYSYIKPLNGSIGPRQTKCISTETLDFLDLEKAVLVTLSTQTPDVPSGNVFCTKTKYLFTWAANNQTRFLMTCTIEWSGKSWLKGPIEKGAMDGQSSFGSELLNALRVAVTPRGRAASKAAGKGKGRRKKGDVAAEEAAAAAVKAASDTSAQQAQNWGPLEPVRGILEPVTSVLKPLWNGNLAVLVVGVLLFLIFFRSPSQPSMLSHEIGCPGYSLPQRLAAYEEMWRREESELWGWLEDRVGMDSLAFPTVNRPGELRAHERARKVQSGREYSNKLDNEKMSVREMDYAIRTTRERLDTLEKILVDRKKQATAGADDAIHTEL